MHFHGGENVTRKGAESQENEMNHQIKSTQQDYFRGKVALVTGGGKGIGREIARLFGAAGCRVAITGRDPDALDRTAQEFRKNGIEILTVSGDVSRVDDCRRVISRCVDGYGQLDILVNNAGMTMRGMFRDISLELFHGIMDVNFRGTVNMTKLSLDELEKSGGSVIFISSLAGLKGLPGVSPYCSSKMALTALGESLRSEYGGRVHFGTLYVSFTENDPEKTMYNENGELIPLKRDKTASSQNDVARSVLRLVHKRRRYAVMTAGGKLIKLVYALFPNLAEALITRFAGGSKLYAYDRLDARD